ncbi:MAG: hypothetical protein KatS3mg105_2341 [Gemmatales bacterium]|nr:MAG: hypothetical protein KatS3mg105_2341 [Gemmatales bacterium]
MEQKKKRPGAVAPLVAILLVPMLIALALALDGGLMLDNKRKVQAAADAAALAGAVKLYKNYPSQQGTDVYGIAKQAAFEVAAANGFPDATGDEGGSNAGKAFVSVRVSPEAPVVSSPVVVDATGNLRPGYIEVIITYHQPAAFVSLIGTQSVAIQARAVARASFSDFNAGVMALDPKDDQSLKTNGNGVINVVNGDIIVNSIDYQAAKTAGNATITVTNGKNIFVTGGASGGGFNPPPITGVAPTPDPLAYLPTPAVPSTNGTITTHGKSGNKTMTPGYYSQAVKFTNGNITMQPGIYYFAKGFDVSGQASVSGSGVMMFNAGNGASQGISITGQGSVSLSPPTSGVYKGILVFQDRASDAPIKVAGNGQFNITGTFYAAGGDVAIEGNGDTSVAGQVIANQIVVGGNGETNIKYNGPDAPAARVIQLVE